MYFIKQQPASCFPDTNVFSSNEEKNVDTLPWQRFPCMLFWAEARSRWLFDLKSDYKELTAWVGKPKVGMLCVLPLFRCITLEVGAAALILRLNWGLWFSVALFFQLRNPAQLNHVLIHDQLLLSFCSRCQRDDTVQKSLRRNFN